MFHRVIHNPSRRCIRLKGIRSLSKDIHNHNSKSILLNLRVIRQLLNKAMLRHNPSSLRLSPNLILILITPCPICRRDRSRMRVEQTICRFSRTKDFI